MAQPVQQTATIQAPPSLQQKFTTFLRSTAKAAAILGVAVALVSCVDVVCHPPYPLGWCVAHRNLL